MAAMDTVIVLCITLTAANIVHAACPDGFEAHGYSCYKGSLLEASWAEAQMYCQILDSDLAVIESADEEVTLTGMLTALHGLGVDDSYWVGGSDIISEGDWRWIYRGGQSSPMTSYSNWPSGNVPSDSRQHNCLALHYRRGKTTWQDETCNTLHSFICEIKYGYTTPLDKLTTTLGF